MLSRDTIDDDKNGKQYRVLRLIYSGSTPVQLVFYISFLLQVKLIIMPIRQV